MTQRTQLRLVAHKFRLLVAVAALVALATACLTPDQKTTFDLVNGSRAQHGLAGLSWDPGAQQWAQNQAETLARRGSLAHSDLHALLGASGARGAAENVGYGSDIGGIHNSYMGSPDHRANILGPYSHLGVGVARAGNRVYTVHVFLLR